MGTAEGVLNFGLPLFSWNAIPEETKSYICSFVDSNEHNTRDIFDLYFSQFHVLHKIGHIISHMFDDEHRCKPGRTEYCANLFAVKYLQEKKQHDYLESLRNGFEYLLRTCNTNMCFDRAELDSHFLSMKKDIRNYLLFHGKTFLDCLSNTWGLHEVLDCLSKLTISQYNQSVLLRQNITGRELVQEVLFYLFEMNQLPINVQCLEQSTLDENTLDLVLL